MALFARSEHRDGRSAVGYLVALLVCGAAAALEYLLQPLLGERFPLALFPAAVIVVAWFGGFGPGLLATLIAGLVGAYFFKRPVQELHVDAPANAASILLFTLAGLLVSLAVRHLRRQARAERDARADTERKLRQTDQLQQLTATVSRARTPADVIRASLPELLHAVDAAAGAVFLVSEDRSHGELAHAIGFGDSLVASARRFGLSSKTPLAAAFRHHELLTIDTGAATLFEGERLSSDPALNAHRSAIVVPLLAAGRTIGAILLTFSRHRVVEGDEREFLQSAGHHTAQAFERARLYDAAERARAEAEAFRARADSALLERQRAEEALRLSEAKYRALAARTSRLYALSAALSEAVSLQDVAKAIVSHGKIVVGATGGALVTLVDDGGHFDTVYAEEFPHSAIDSPHRFPAEPGLCATTVAETRQPVFVGSFAEWQDKYPRSASIGADGGYASVAALPLLAEGVVIGVLSFYFTVPVNFDDEYKALLTSVAQHCAQALDRGRLYESAEQARADAEAANQSKDDFLSTISHELRTPLNAILGWAAMLRSGSIQATRAHRAVEAIFDNATRQGRLIEELLDVSRIVAGRASLDLQDVELGENIRGAVEAMMPAAAAKNVDLTFKPPADVHVVGDPRRLEQVFLNLLSNAVKFTAPGGSVQVDVTASDAVIQVRVLDNGGGIDQDFLPHVFERFRQADSTTKRSVGGLGLGLFIARHLVEAQAGTIRVDSEGPGRGATFTVTLPAAQAPGVHAVIVNDAEPLEPGGFDAMPLLTGVRVLLVDDEPDTLEMMASALETCGATVTAASSVRDALHTLAHEGIDVLLSDIAMPGEDGYTLIREIRAMSAPGVASIPAAAVTACVREDERERALAAGFHTHLAKPVQPIALALAVARLAQAGAMRIAHEVQ